MSSEIFEETSKRGHERLIAYWEKLKGDRAFPEETDIDTDAISDLWSSCFLLNTQKEGSGGYHYEFMGPSLVEAYGSDLTGMAHTEDTEPHIASILASFSKVVEGKTYMVDESEFTNTHGQQVKYRACLIPFGSAPDQVKYIIGLMGWTYST